MNLPCLSDQIYEVDRLEVLVVEVAYELRRRTMVRLRQKISLHFAAFNPQCHPEANAHCKHD